jgi:hypothetical protein
VSILLAVKDSRVTPGLLGLLVVALLVAATVFLLRSLNKQLKRVNFEEGRPPTPPDTGRAGGSDPEDPAEES